MEQTIAGTASNSMNIHEYQGKEILKTFGVGIQEGIVADTADAAVAAAKKLSEQTGQSESVHSFWTFHLALRTEGRRRSRRSGRTRAVESLG